MAKIIIDGTEIECQEGRPVLQVALEAGYNIPHYCYHPALSVVASCRLCLMEIKMPDPKTKEMVWSPKLVPSCQTPARDGLEVRFDTEKVKRNVERVMEYYLINHPLDCPICDQAGECHLQDYSYQFGAAQSRMVEPKHVNPKKDIGPHTLLYQDRCVMCSRCVRFTEEISGTGELCIVNRGNRAEIDIFPGVPLDNKLQGNVVDICPVGSLLDKQFLFTQRVWFLKGTDSVCPGCSTGCTIRIDHNRGRIYRLMPRYNPRVNNWWMCDEGRFGWKFVHDDRRIAVPVVRTQGQDQPINWSQLSATIRQRLQAIVDEHGAGAIACQLSPEMSCEEAWLLGSFIKSIAPQAPLVLGEVRTVGGEETFPAGSSVEDARFVIRPEKDPNRRGVEMVIAALGGGKLNAPTLWKQLADGHYQGVWIVGGYPRRDWPAAELVKALDRPELVIVQEMLPNAVSEKADMLLPFGAWVERAGCFVNHAGVVQPFEAAIKPPEDGQRMGQYLYQLAGHSGIYNPAAVRAMMAETMPEFAEVYTPPPKPKHQH